MSIYLLYVGGDRPYRVEQGGTYADFPTHEAAEAYRRVLARRR